MIAALLLLANAPMTAIDAERAFAAAAQKEGQWTAFRQYGAEDAVMFTPRRVAAREWLKDRENPEHAIVWAPAESYVSCDGRLAANTGPWRGHNGRVGYFSTIWRTERDGRWRWTLDAGDTLKAARWRFDAKPVVRRAACDRRPTAPPQIAFRCSPQAVDKGASADGTLAYFGYIACGGRGRGLYVWLWNGKDWDEVIHDNAAIERGS